MKVVFLFLLFISSLFCKAQNRYKYYFGTENKITKLSKSDIDSTIKVLSKRLIQNNFKDAEVSFDSAKNYFSIANNKIIDTQFIKAFIVNNGKAELEMYELYTHIEFIKITSANSNNKQLQSKFSKLFSILDTMDFDKYYHFSYLGRIKIKDSLLFKNEIKKLKIYLPKDLILAKGSEKDDFAYSYVYGLKNNKNKLVVNDIIDSASADLDELSRPSIKFHFNKEGADLFGILTEQNTQKYIAIVLNKNVYSAPLVTSKIDGGSIQISGNFSYREAREFATILLSKSIPIKLKFVKSEIL